MSGPNLLVVDWDFFFPNPCFSMNLTGETGLYLWDHREAPAYLSSIVWAPRAAAFLRNGLELPRAQGWEDFWERFVWSWEDTEPTLLYGDSNVHAGLLTPQTFGWDEPAWDTVSLWDAHHDCGYDSTGSLEQWRARNQLTCEDWMLVHHERGSTLEVVYPAWRGEVGNVEPEPLVPVDRRVDDGTNHDRPYDAVYVCRSGAWVPPWCDADFTRFVEAGPDSFPMEVPGNEWVHPRPDVTPEARAEIEAYTRLGALIDHAAGKVPPEERHSEAP